MISLPPDTATQRRTRVLGRRYHFNIGGLVYVITTIVLLFGAISSQNNLLFWMFGLAIAGLMASGVLSGTALMGLDLYREVTARGAVREPLHIRYTVTNRNFLLPVFCLEIEELTSFGRRKPVGSTWSKHLPPVRAFVAVVRPRGTADAITLPLPTARGHAKFAAVRISTTFPFGLVRKSVTFAIDSDTIVRPSIPAIHEDVAAELLDGHGESPGRVKRSRAGREFFALRDAAHTDSARDIAWRASARLDRLVVQERAQRPSRRLFLIPLPGETQAGTEAAISATAALARLALERGMSVGLALPIGTTVLMARHGAKHLEAILDSLALWESSAADGAISPYSTAPSIGPRDHTIRIGPQTIGTPGHGMTIAPEQILRDPGSAPLSTPAALGAAPVPERAT